MWTKIADIYWKIMGVIGCVFMAISAIALIGVIGWIILYALGVVNA